jgi:hypothetical protein
MFARTLPVALVLALSACAQEQAPPPANAGTAAASGYTRDTPVERFAADPAAAAIVNKDLPGLLTNAQYPLFKTMSLKQLQSASGGDLSEADVDKTVADLQALFPH